MIIKNLKTLKKNDLLTVIRTFQTKQDNRLPTLEDFCVFIQHPVSAWISFAKNTNDENKKYIELFYNWLQAETKQYFKNNSGPSAKKYIDEVMKLTDQSNTGRNFIIKFEK